MSKPPPVRSSETPSLDVEIVVEDEHWHVLGDVEGIVGAAADALSSLRADLFDGATAATVMLADDAHVASLNGTFRGKPAPTNVLSFPAGVLGTGDGAPRYLGDIILARETVEREAREQDIAVAHHIQHLTVHGILHLIGFDHLTDDDAAEMEAIETSVLASLGVPDPYAPELFEPATK